MSLQRQLLILICCLLSAAFLFKAGFLSLQRWLIVPSNHPLLAQATSQLTPQAAISDTRLPQRLIIDQQNLNLPIIATPVIDGEWQVTDQGVSLLYQSQNPFAGYVLYGHNWPVLLQNLHSVQLGQTIVLEYEYQSAQTYEVVSRFVVRPDQLDILHLAQEDTLVLYTCTGFLDSQRLVIIAQKI